ncbi:type II toxin-antitoxin system RelE/ParE family toxin [Agrobacterium sp. a22-2]|uniref:type II toxin-antitoxin system RelE/ParE family toxin n=1 Tax=Agrobacterium sp. a22-2 TaxID=2283840 RepID=UPI001447B45F|nr:type II toxin-antitoxin system RelE/ParE family toxin [Agrobacterium sp. a22-2]
MIPLRFTRQAEADILSIHDYTIETFGIAQWSVYESGLRSAFERISQNPQSGTDLSSIKPDTRRLMFKSHAIYYRTRADDVLVLRVLGLRQDPGRHL